MKIISIVNHKGGVGKTNTAINLAAALASLSRQVLLIDLDPQGNTSRGYGIDTSLVDHSIMDVIAKKYSINSCIQPTVVKNLEIVPSRLIISALDETKDANYFLLKNGLEKLKKSYDYILIDCPPSLGMLTLNAFVASDSIIIPVQCQYFALNAITQILANVSIINSKYNPNLKVEGALLTMYDPSSSLDNEIAEDIRNIFKSKTYVTKIPRTNSIPESNAKGIPVTLWRPSGKASSSYIALAKEVIDQENN